MARHLRHHVPGGWYHITTRGLGRRDIFKNDRDHEHFLELLAGMVERYNIILHAHAELWRRGSEKGEDPVRAYREWVEDYLKQGVEEKKMMTKISSALAIGSVAFIAKLRNEVLKDRKTKSNRRSWERLLSFEEVVRAVEEVRGGAWDVFRSRRGDLGRGVVLSIARAHCGLTLQELGDKAEMSFDAVSKAVSRINKRMTVDRELKELHDLSVSKLGQVDERLREL